MTRRAAALVPCLAVLVASACAAPASAADVADADAAVVEQAPSKLKSSSPGSKDSSGGKRQAMSHPVEVPAEELS